MNDNIESGEDIVLLCLRSVDKDQINILQLQSVGISVYEFDDADEYVQYLLSVNQEDTFIFAWLGFGWNHLIATLDDFEQVYYIYLSEPTEEKRVTKVRGIFTDVVKLLQQVSVDAHVCQLHQSTHLNVFDNKEVSTIQDQNGNTARSMWSQTLLQALLRMPSPTTDVHREMLDEARYFYRNNPAQLAQINNFQQNYRIEDAIKWYSRDSFTYRLMNKALRTQNLAIIFKFRFFIRDVYEQLKRLYCEQNLSTRARNGQQPTIKLHRAMRVSPVERNRLRSCHSGTILSVNSFVSTSRSPNVAMMYLGADPERDIMLEISIDTILLDSDTSPFADISKFSAFPDEEETLLAMGTTLQVQSVTSNTQKKHIYIEARLCYEEDAEVKELKTYILEQLPFGRDESYYVTALANLLCQTDDYEKLGQIMKLFKPDTNDVLREAYCSLIRLSNSLQHSNNESIGTSYCLDMVSKINQLLQNSQVHPDLANSVRNALSPLAELHTGLSSEESFRAIPDIPDFIQKQMRSVISLLDQISLSLPLPSSHPIFSRFQFLKGGFESIQDRHQQALDHFDMGHAFSSVSLLDNNNFSQQLAMVTMAESVAKLGDDDRSLRILESLHMPARPQVRTLNALAKYHERHEDLPMAIACYRTVIEECNLAPNSLEIVGTYNSIASAFLKLEDTDLALWNYRRAHDLLLQHHPSTHPRLSEIETSILLAESMRELQQILKRLGRN